MVMMMMHIVAQFHFSLNILYPPPPPSPPQFLIPNNFPPTDLPRLPTQRRGGPQTVSLSLDHHLHGVPLRIVLCGPQDFEDVRRPGHYQVHHGCWPQDYQYVDNCYAVVNDDDRLSNTFLLLLFSALTYLFRHFVGVDVVTDSSCGHFGSSVAFAHGPGMQWFIVIASTSFHLH